MNELCQTIAIFEKNDQFHQWLSVFAEYINLQLLQFLMELKKMIFCSETSLKIYLQFLYSCIW